ncbi:hypothetical protein ES703_117147 [subsurface metagenome]
MKFLSFGMFDVAKVADVAQASDKFWASPPPGVKMLADYVCLGIPFPGAPPNTVVGVSVFEAESAEVLTAASYPLMLAGASLWNVPVMEMPVAGAAELENKMRR